ncbi:CG42823, partial [Drosophila busckii]
CLRTCNEHYRCNPYHVEPVWSIVDRRCRVFQNGCMFGNINCQRRNECLRPFVQTTQRDCQRACNFICPFGGSWVCATFYDRNSAGQNRERKMSFLNRCLLDLYSCQN